MEITQHFDYVRRFLKWGLVLAVISVPMACRREVAHAPADRGRPHRASEPLALLDIEGNHIDPLATADAKVVVFLFVRSDCPISNRYAPEVRQLHTTYSPQGVKFWLVYCDPNESLAAIRRHLSKYSYPLPALRDNDHQLVKMTAARVTPEAAAFVPGGRMVYRGRIDDRYIGFGKSRAEPTRRVLADALDAVLEGREVANPITKAVGCYIADLD